MGREEEISGVAIKDLARFAAQKFSQPFCLEHTADGVTSPDIQQRTKNEKERDGYDD